VEVGSAGDPRRK